MKITNGQQHYLNAIRQNKKTTIETTNKAAEVKKQSEQTSVEISDEAKKLSQANLAAAPSEKAKAIKQAIQNGTYQVSTEKITQSIVNHITEQKKAAE